MRFDDHAGSWEQSSGGRCREALGRPSEGAPSMRRGCTRAHAMGLSEFRPAMTRPCSELRSVTALPGGEPVESRARTSHRRRCAQPSQSRRRSRRHYLRMESAGSQPRRSCRLHGSVRARSPPRHDRRRSLVPGARATECRIPFRTPRPAPLLERALPPMHTSRSARTPPWSSGVAPRDQAARARSASDQMSVGYPAELGRSAA
jgi:hypothetical protein